MEKQKPPFFDSEEIKKEYENKRINELEKMESQISHLAMKLTNPDLSKEEQEKLSNDIFELKTKYQNILNANHRKDNETFD